MVTLGLDYVSPLPPVASGIADYSIDLLPHLCELADVRVLALAGQPVAEAVQARYHPEPAETVGQTGRLPLYQMGNNPYHAEIWRLARERPGVLTLHDWLLHHLAGHLTLGRADFHAYRRQLEVDHGWVGAATALPRRFSLESQASLFSLPVHRSLLLAQRGVLVHSRWAAERVAEENPEVRVRAIPMGIPLPAAADPAAGLALRRRLSIPESVPLLGSFGFQTPIKRTAAVVAALSDPRLAAAHLVVVGEASPALDLAGEAARAGVAERVHVMGYVPWADFEAAVSAVDVCLNLRYPTAGETSASLLRVLAAGRPAIVSDYGQFRDLPEAVALRVPLGEGESESLAAALAELLESPERLAAMGRAARAHVRSEHDPAESARQIVEACLEWRELSPPGPRPPRERPATSLVAPGEVQAGLEVAGADRPWAEGERREVEILLTNAGQVTWLAAEKGPGGLALEVVFSAGEGGPPRPWRGLPRDVPPGEQVGFRVPLRRPLGEAELRLRLWRLGPWTSQGGPEALVEWRRAV
ncbi:MAG TPA: glycosyltransferase family 4 protein [Thermoanaerobaculia bacterium]|nr:glycosyltransferase family 4 protein [Thermoanaerobaculia bacterium]